MIFTETPLKGSYIVTPEPRGDSRGWFMRSFCKNEFASIGHTAEWVQMNHSFTKHKGTVRGMHFQMEPHTEIKLVRCIAGSVYDVIIDMRKDSATYLKWFGEVLSAENKKMMYVPQGFAHGFQALTDEVELLYNHSAFYKPAFESGILYNDEQINIQWPIPVTEISERDKSHPPL
ncbi:MAG: dTDP-4-dehydrorhamnose 3,5-epimerase [Ferruginibacter sp.]